MFQRRFSGRKMWRHVDFHLSLASHRSRLHPLNARWHCAGVDWAIEGQRFHVINYSCYYNVRGLNYHADKNEMTDICKVKCADDMHKRISKLLQCTKARVRTNWQEFVFRVVLDTRPNRLLMVRKMYIADNEIKWPRFSPPCIVVNLRKLKQWADFCH